MRHVHHVKHPVSHPTPVFKRIFKYIRIFKYFPPNIDIQIRFVVIFKAEYYSNIQIFCPNIYKYWSLKIRGNAGIKEV